MAPERPLSRMTIEILCPCPAWELALFCAVPQVPHLRDQYFKIWKLATFLNVFKIIMDKNRDQSILNLPTVLEQVPAPSMQREGGLCLLALVGWPREQFALAGLDCRGNLLCFVIAV
jgi:hypothetical protein